MLLSVASISSMRSPDEMRALAEEILRDGYQTAVSTTPPDLRGAMAWLVPGLKVALCVVLGILAFVVVRWIAQQLRRRRAPGELPGNMVVEPSAACHADVLAEPDLLAARGEYAEATHRLLLGVLGRLSQRLALPSSLTSREILRSSALDDRLRSGLGHLVAAVEVSLFGGLALTREDYERCREQYRALAPTLEGAP